MKRVEERSREVRRGEEKKREERKGEERKGEVRAVHTHYSTTSLPAL